jgi:hypothetical protein
MSIVLHYVILLYLHDIEVYLNPRTLVVRQTYSILYQQWTVVLMKLVMSSS